jgi:parvulin-like peptidyl-prolyl isomerase
MNTRSWNWNFNRQTVRNNNDFTGRALFRAMVTALALLISIGASGLAPWGPFQAHAEESSIVAKVNGSAITIADLDAEIDKILPTVSYHGSVSKEAREEFREQALDRLVDRELQYQDARAKGLKPDSGQVKKRMSDMRGQFPSKKEYQKALEQAGLTESQLKLQVEKEVLVEQHIESTVTGPARMSGEDLKEYYTRNTAKFVQPETVHVRILSVKDEKKAREAYARITGGETFGSVAGRMSEDNYRIKGGDIGSIHRGRLLPELEQAAFSLKPGEVSDVIKAENIWFILKVEESSPARQLALDEVKDKLRKELETKRAKEIMNQWMTGLKSKAKIELLNAK